MRLFKSLLLVFAVAATAQADLINHWKLDGNFDDTAPAGTNADNGSQPGSSVTFDAGNTYAIFNGADDAYVEVPDSADIVAAGESLSISAWFQVSGLDDSWQGLVAHGESTDYRIARRGDDNVISYAGGAGDIPTSAIGPDISPDPDAWHHVLAVSPLGGPAAIYVNGSLVETGANTTLTDNGSGRLMIGGNPDTGPGFRTWNGGIDDVAMYDQALNANAAKQIFLDGRGNLNVVPEPGTGILALMGAACLGLLRRRR